MIRPRTGGFQRGAYARAHDEAHQHGLGLIVGGVAERDRSAADAAAHAPAPRTGHPRRGSEEPRDPRHAADVTGTPGAPRA